MEEISKNESLQAKAADWLACWLTCDNESIPEVPLSDFERIREKIQPADVILIEGRSRVSRVISTITKSPWTHAGLYIGRLSDIQDPELLTYLKKYYHGDPHEQLIVESLMGKGVLISALSQYQHEHIRICRPKGLPLNDAHQVIHYAIQRVGKAYDNQQIFDLARFLFPWFLLPRRWRSSLFSYQAGESTKLTCSLLVAEAFMSIHYPILPLVRKNGIKGYEFIRRNSRLFTPRDFDYSPYFDIIKYPIIEFSDKTPYTTVPWNDELMSNDKDGIFTPQKNQGKPHDVSY